MLESVPVLRDECLPQVLHEQEHLLVVNRAGLEVVSTVEATEFVVLHVHEHCSHADDVPGLNDTDQRIAKELRTHPRPLLREVDREACKDRDGYTHGMGDSRLRNAIQTSERAWQPGGERSPYSTTPKLDELDEGERLDLVLSELDASIIEDVS